MHPVGRFDKTNNSKAHPNRRKTEINTLIKYLLFITLLIIFTLNQYFAKPHYPALAAKVCTSNF